MIYFNFLKRKRYGETILKVVIYSLSIAVFLGLIYEKFKLESEVERINAEIDSVKRKLEEVAKEEPEEKMFCPKLTPLLKEFGKKEIVSRVRFESFKYREGTGEIKGVSLNREGIEFLLKKISEFGDVELKALEKQGNLLKFTVEFYLRKE